MFDAIKGHGTTLKIAINDKRHVIDSIIGVVVGVIHALGVYFEIPVMKDISIWLVGPGIVLFLLFWWTLTYATTLRKRFDPAIKISDPIETIWPKSGNDPQFTRFISLEIENISTEQIRNCTVKETRLTNVDGINSEIVGRVLRVDTERYVTDPNFQYTQTFNLNGKGTKQRVDVAQLVERRDGGRDNVNVIMAYASNISKGLPNSIPLCFFPHVIEIEFSADNLAVPAKKTYKLLVGVDGQLKMEPKF